jgi:signal transduction histidine kinase
MTQDKQHQEPAASRFYCYAVGIAPEEGRHRTVLARLEELRSRNVWLVRLRWLAVCGFVAATTVARYVFETPVEAGRLYAVAAVLLAYNVVMFLLVTRKAADAPVERQLFASRVLATGQMAVDLLLLTVMLHYSGGAENPFFFYFVFHMIIGSILLERRASFYIATLAVALFCVLALGEYWGILRHYQVWPAEHQLHRNGVYVLAALVVFASTMYLSVYFAGSIVEKLRARDAELVNVTSNLEKGSLELAEAYEKIRALEERKSEFFRIASHQLRSPLSAIRSLLDVVLDGYATDPGKGRELLQRAHDRTDLMIAMVGDLLALSQLKDTAQIVRNEAENVDACRLLSELESLYRPRAQAKNLRLDVKLPAEGCLIRATVDDVRQALNNLLDNAINYTPDGGSVTVSAQASGGRLVIRVGDTGIGIPEDALGRLFEEFYRAPNAKQTQPHGTGLGLVIVKRAVEKWGGSVTVQSQPDTGSTFTLDLPSA